MPWKRVGEARLAPSLSQDVLLISVGEDDLYSVSVSAARSALRGARATLCRRYTTTHGSYLDIRVAASMWCARGGGPGVYVAIDGRLYGINRDLFEQVLDGASPGAAVVEKIEAAGQLDDATSRQTELGGWGRCCGTKNMEEYANDL